MVDVDKAIIARIKKEGENFEILVDCDNALALKKGKSVGMKDVLASDKIFSDSKKGLVASETKLNQIFGTADPDDIARVIIKEGEIQLTSQYRARIKEQMSKRILNYIHRNAIDPKTGIPHPMQRIELAFAEAKIKIDDHKAEEQQINEIMKKLKPIIPISFATKEIAIRIPSEFAGKSYSLLKTFAKVIKEEWLNDGSYACVVDIPAGMQNDLFDKLNNATKGCVETKILKVKT